MAWVRLLADDEVTDEVRAVFDVGREHYDQVLHAWRAIAHCPDAFVAYLPYLRAVVGPGHGVDEANILGVADPGATRPTRTSRAAEAQAVNAPVLARVEALFNAASRG